MEFINKEVFLAISVWLREVGVRARLPWSEGVGGEERKGGRECRQSLKSSAVEGRRETRE